MKKIIVVLAFLMTGLAFSQTTVTLEDQCNCEVLSGPDVTASGMTTPAGADTGDIYVNTNTGTIYYWDGDSWELTAVDTNTTNSQFEVVGPNLVLTDSDGNALSVPLTDIGTDSQTLTTDNTPGNLGITGGNTIALNVDDADSNASNEVNTRFEVVGANLEIEDASGTLLVPLTAIGSDNQTITDFSYDDATRIVTLTLENGNTSTVNLSELSETVIAGTGAITVNDDGNGNYTVNSTDPDEDATNEIQNLSTDGTAGDISIVGGNNISLNVDDADADPTNEIELPTGGTNGQILSTDGSGTYSWIDDPGTDNQNIENLGLSGTTLTVGIEDGTSQTVDLAPLADHDWYEVGGTSPPNAITDNIFTRGAVGIGTADPERLLHVVGDNATIRNSRSVNSANIILDRYSGAISNTLASSIIGLNSPSVGEGKFFLANYNETVGGNGYTTWLAFDIETNQGSFDQYGLGNFTGTTAFLLGVEADGDLIEVNPSTLGSDDQNIAGLAVDISSNILTVGIEGGTGQTVNLSHLDDSGTDSQVLSTDGTSGAISISGGNNINLNVDDADADATNEIQTLSQTGTNVTLSNGGGAISVADNDNDSTNEIELPTGGTNGQVLSTDGSGTYTWINDDGGADTQDLSIDAAGTTISLVDGGSVTVDVDDADADATNEHNTAFAVVGTNLRITDGGGALQVPLASIGSDDQGLSHTVIVPNEQVRIEINDGTNTTISIEDADADASNELQDLNLDVNNILTLSNPATPGNQVDLSGLLNTNLATDDLTQDAETRIYDMNTQDLTFTNGSFGIGTANPAGTLDVQSAVNHDAFRFTQTNVTTGERDVFTIIDQDGGGGGQDESSVLKVLKSGNISTGDDGFSLIELASTGTDPGDNKYWISGRTSDEGAVKWGVDITDNDYWSEGGILLGANSIDGGTYSGGTFRVEADGDTGVGTTTPDARLDVEGGAVRFTDYAAATTPYENSSADYLLATDAEGDVVQVNSVKSSRIFYPPSIAIDASVDVVGATKNLYQEYVNQYAPTTAPFTDTFVASSGAPGAIPTYGSDELYYYVTYYDPTVFDNVSISNTGVMTYDIIDQPADYNSLINVVFVVK